MSRVPQRLQAPPATRSVVTLPRSRPSSMTTRASTGSTRSCRLDSLTRSEVNGSTRTKTNRPHGPVLFWCAHSRALLQRLEPDALGLRAFFAEALFLFGFVFL